MDIWFIPFNTNGTLLKGTDLYGVLLRMSHVLNESNDSNNNNNNNNKWSQYYIHNSPIIVDIFKEFQLLLNKEMVCKIN